MTSILMWRYSRKPWKVIKLLPWCWTRSRTSHGNDVRRRAVPSLLNCMGFANAMEDIPYASWKVVADASVPIIDASSMGEAVRVLCSIVIDRFKSKDDVTAIASGVCRIGPVPLTDVFHQHPPDENSLMRLFYYKRCILCARCPFAHTATDAAVGLGTHPSLI